MGGCLFFLAVELNRSQPRQYVDTYNFFFQPLLAMKSAKNRGSDGILLAFYRTKLIGHTPENSTDSGKLASSVSSMVVSLPQKLRGVRNIVPKMGPSRAGHPPHSLPVHRYTATPEQQTTHVYTPPQNSIPQAWWAPSQDTIPGHWGSVLPTACRTCSKNR